MTTVFTILGYIFAVMLVCFVALLFFVTCRGLSEIIAEHEDYEPDKQDAETVGKADENCEK